MIEVRGLRMRYGSVDVLEGVEFTARRGEVLVLLGPNGAGKTTTVEILEGFRRRSAGEVRVLGVDPAKGGEDWRARIGIVLQSWRDHGRWKVRELLAHMGRYYEPYRTLQRERPYNADKLLGSVGLRSQADARIASLSGVQHRQLDVAIGLARQSTTASPCFAPNAAFRGASSPRRLGFTTRPSATWRGASTVPVCILRSRSPSISRYRWR
jgi:ABC-2 type transport system ATP-binding protein